MNESINESVTFVPKFSKPKKVKKSSKAFSLEIFQFDTLVIIDISRQLGFQDHMRSQHSGIDEPRVQCSLCGAWLKNRGTLMKHYKIHTEKSEENVCDVCHKKKLVKH